MASETTTPPAWFTANVNAPRTEYTIDVEGCPIHCLRWDDEDSDCGGSGGAGGLLPQSPAAVAAASQQAVAAVRGGGAATTTASRRRRGGPGLLLLHGNFANAHWWAHVAPFWATRGQFSTVVAMSISGHGNSGWRPEYGFHQWAREVEAVGRHAGFSADAGCVLVAHSMGVVVATTMDHHYNGGGGAAAEGASPVFAGMVLLDETPRTPGYFQGLPQISHRPALERWRPAAVTPASKLQLRPPQKIRNRYVVDYIAGMSTRQRSAKVNASGAGGGAGGGAAAAAAAADGTEWAWSFDPAKDQKMRPSDWFPFSVERYLSADVVRGMRCRTAIVVGDESFIVPPPLVEYTRMELGDRVPLTVLRNCGHHLMVDQPLSLVAAVDAIVAAWRTVPTLPDGTPLPPVRRPVSPRAGAKADAVRGFTWKQHAPFLQFREPTGGGGARGRAKATEDDEDDEDGEGDEGEEEEGEKAKEDEEDEEDEEKQKQKAGRARL